MGGSVVPAFQVAGPFSQSSGNPLNFKSSAGMRNFQLADGSGPCTFGTLNVGLASSTLAGPCRGSQQLLPQQAYDNGWYTRGTGFAASFQMAKKPTGCTSGDPVSLSWDCSLYQDGWWPGPRPATVTSGDGSWASIPEEFRTFNSPAFFEKWGEGGTRTFGLRSALWTQGLFAPSVTTSSGTIAHHICARTGCKTNMTVGTSISPGSLNVASTATPACLTQAANADVLLGSIKLEGDALSVPVFSLSGDLIIVGTISSGAPADVPGLALAMGGIGQDPYGVAMANGIVKMKSAQDWSQFLLRIVEPTSSPVGMDGLIYVGGDFTDWDPSSPNFSTMFVSLGPAKLDTSYDSWITTNMVVREKLEAELCTWSKATGPGSFDMPGHGLTISAGSGVASHTMEIKSLNCRSPLPSNFSFPSLTPGEWSTVSIAGEISGVSLGSPHEVPIHFSSIEAPVSIQSLEAFVWGGKIAEADSSGFVSFVIPP